MLTRVLLCRCQVVRGVVIPDIADVVAAAGLSFTKPSAEAEAKAKAAAEASDSDDEEGEEGKGEGEDEGEDEGEGESESGDEDESDGEADDDGEGNGEEGKKKTKKGKKERKPRKQGSRKARAQYVSVSLRPSLLSAAQSRSPPTAAQLVAQEAAQLRALRVAGTVVSGFVLAMQSRCCAVRLARGIIGRVSNKNLAVRTAVLSSRCARHVASRPLPVVDRNANVATACCL